MAQENPEESTGTQSKKGFQNDRKWNCKDLAHNVVQRGAKFCYRRFPIVAIVNNTVARTRSGGLWRAAKQSYITQLIYIQQQMVIRQPTDIPTQLVVCSQALRARRRFPTQSTLRSNYIIFLNFDFVWWFQCVPRVGLSITILQPKTFH